MSLMRIIPLSITILISVCALMTAPFAYAIDSIRVSSDDKRTRVVLSLGQPFSHTYFSLKAPDRLVIDIPGVSTQYSLSGITDKHARLKRVRYSTPKSPQDTRLVLELNNYDTKDIFKLEGSGSDGNRLVIDLFSNKSLTVAKTNNPRQPRKSAAERAVITASDTTQREIIIAIDAGHGGSDPGSVGSAGTYEKNITLSVAKMLAGRVDKTRGLKAELIRTGDYYIHPNKRPEIARQKKADLFISIHADAFHKPQPRGGSVWVLSKGRADNELGRWLERTERHSELLGGAAEVITDKASERYLAETILGLSMDHSIASSYDLSEHVIARMKGVTRMHKKQPQAASLAVLTSPDIPSILVELGFISNPQEEKNLNWSAYRQKLAESIYQAVVVYFKQTPPDGTLWASQKRESRTHKVRSGESLSVLAARYNTTVANLKNANSLSSDMVRVGQVLRIPQT